MTYTEFRKFGYVSRLSELVAKGPSSSTLGTQQQLTQQQLALGQQQQQLSGEDRARGMALQAPLINQQTALAGGDRNAAVAAAMPQISQISAGYGAAKNSIFNQVGAGASRDAILADLETKKYTAQAGAQAQAVQNAPGILAGLGQQGLGYSLQELGAGLAGFGGASTSNQAVGQMQKAQSDAKWQPIVGLAGAAGSAVGLGGLSSLLGGGASAGGGGGGGRSDRRLKKNIRSLDSVLAAIAALQIVQFEYNELAAPNSDELGENIGVIAQDIEHIFPQAVYHEGRYKSVKYGVLAAVALKGIQELAERVEVLEEEIRRIHTKPTGLLIGVER